MNFQYGADYINRFKPQDGLPKSELKSAIQGPQPALSGSQTFPDIALGTKIYRADSLKWQNSNAFVIPLKLTSQP